MRRLSLLLLFGFLISCSDNQTSSTSEDIEFGAPYSIITTSDMPTISNEVLNSRVSYSGCNPDHEFELKSNNDNSVTEIWLFKKPLSNVKPILRKNENLRYPKVFLDPIKSF